VNWKERLSKKKWEWTVWVNPQSRFLLDLDLLLKMNERVNTLEESIRLNCKERRKMNVDSSPYSFTFSWFDWTRSRGFAPCSVRVRYSQLFLNYLFHLLKPLIHFFLNWKRKISLVCLAFDSLHWQWTLSHLQSPFFPFSLSCKERIGQG